MGKVALVVTLLGFVGLVVGLIGTIAFSSSDEFVKATLYCDSETDPNCDAETNTVTGADGEVCQVGNLGLFVSSYTPECADGTSYELSDQVAPITDSPTTEFGILFPGQTEFAGIVADNGFPEFTDCEEYFESAAFTAGLANFSATTDAERLEPFRAGLKEQFDLGIDDIVALLDSTVFLAGVNAEAALAAVDLAAINPAFAGLTLNSSDISAAVYPGSVNWDTFMLGLVSALSSANATAQAQALGGARALVAAVCSGMAKSTAQCLNEAVYAGTADWGTVASVFQTGIGPRGLFSEFGSLYCLATVPGCTYEEYLMNVVLPPLSVADPANAALLTLVLGAISDYFDGVQAALAGSMVPIADRNALKAALQNVTIQPGATYDGLVNKEAFITNTKDSLLQENAIPNSLTTPAAAESQGFGILCPSRGIAADCSFADLIDQLVVLDELDLEDNSTTAGLLTIQSIVTACGAIDFDVCFANIVQTGLISGLYDVPAGASLATMIKNATDQCKDDELDIAAITQAQQLIPVGAGLNGAGLAVAVVALVLYSLGKNPKIAKVVILLGAVVSLIGLALAVVALIGVIGAPIYASVGGDVDREEGDQVFSNSVGYQYILAGAAGNAIGGILLLAGGLCLPTAESDALAAK